MEPSAARPRDRHRLSAAVSLVHLARRAISRASTPALVCFWARRATGRGRLVDGGLRAFAKGGSFAIPSGDTSAAGTCDLCSHRLDLATPFGTAAAYRIVAAENHERPIAGADIRAALFRCAGRGLASGQDL